MKILLPSAGSRNEPNKKQALLPTFHILVFYLAYSSILKTEATSFSETSVAAQQNTSRCIAEGTTLQNHYLTF
jgi:hypothetical protein